MLTLWADISKSQITACHGHSSQTPYAGSSSPTLYCARWNAPSAVDGSWTAAEQHWTGGGAGVRSWHAVSCGELHEAAVDLCFNPKHKDIEIT